MKNNLKINKRYLLRNDKYKIQEVHVLIATDKCYLLKFINRSTNEEKVDWIEKRKINETSSYDGYSIFEELTDSMYKPLEREKKLNRILKS